MTKYQLEIERNKEGRYFVRTCHVGKTFSFNSINNVKNYFRTFAEERPYTFLNLDYFIPKYMGFSDHQELVKGLEKLRKSLVSRLKNQKIEVTI